MKGPSSFDDGLALDSSGNIYASRYYGSTITKIDRSGKTSIFASGFGSPNAITFDHQGNLLVPSATGNKVHRVFKDGTKEVLVDNIQNPTGVAVDSVGNIYISQYSISKILKLDLEGNLSTFLSGGLLNGPVSMIFDDTGDLFIGNFDNGKVLKYSTDSTLSIIGSVSGWLGSFTLFEDKIYAAGFQNNRIYQISKDGSGQGFFAGTGEKGSKDGLLDEATFNSPNGIIMSHTGDTLFISDFSTRSLRMITGIIPNNPKLSSPDTVKFGEINLDVDTIFIKKVHIENVGNDTLHITSISFSDSTFTSLITELSIAPYSADTLIIEFLPNKVGKIHSDVSLYNNSATEVKDIVLSAEVVSNTSNILDHDIPTKTTLHQNFPNPFNPATQISYSLSEPSYIKLEIINSVGQQVAVLENGSRAAGNFTVTFDARNLSSGLYFYQLTTNQGSISKKMLLIK